MKAFSFGGRSGRYDYARFALLLWIGMNLIGALAAVPTHIVDPSFPVHHVPPVLLTISMSRAVAFLLLGAALPMVVAIGLAFLALNVRRFHDFNLSGWYVLLWTVVLNFVPEKDFGDYLPTTTGLIWYAVLVTVPGSAGANRYGPPPATVVRTTAQADPPLPISGA